MRSLAAEKEWPPCVAYFLCATDEVRTIFYHHFTDKKTEAQRVEVNYLKSHSQEAEGLRSGPQSICHTPSQHSLLFCLGRSTPLLGCLLL